MFETILVAIDGSDHAFKALDAAIDLAKRYDSKIIALSVYRHHSPLESTHSMVRARGVVEAPDETLSRLARETVETAVLQARDAGVREAVSLVKRGPPARTIVEVAKKKGADAIVLGSRGLGDVEGLLLGSVSHKVNSLAHCTCITVK